MIGAGYVVGFTIFTGTILFVFLMIAICFLVQRTSAYHHQQPAGTVPVHSINNFHPEDWNLTVDHQARNWI
ncbi:hypothetical protein CFP56_043307 [Quercus suber]|uniref:Uncharacterized protein n=1 Tax=Quercus suber TaxID=58331 RepID=A0AAW0LJ59_QUESU